MNALVQVLALVAAAVHVLFFVLESLLFPSRPPVQKTFQVRAADVEAVRPFLFNQGFYNLFLAAGIVVGLVIEWSGGSDDAALALVCLPLASMVAAALVLLATDRRMARGAAIQGLVPAVALVVAALTA